MENEFLTLDLTIRQDLCNKRCAYCGLTEARVPALGHKDGQVGLIAKDGLMYDAEQPSVIYSRVKKQVVNILKKTHIHMIKVSGGEITAIPGWLELLKSFSTNTVQLLTNGTCLNENIIKQLAFIPNLSVQITLDGVNLKANKYRGMNSKDLSNILSSLRTFLEYDIPLELMCVLTNANLDSFEDYCHFINELVNDQIGKIVILPKPVNGNNRQKFYPSSSSIKEFNRKLKNMPTNVLPHQKYNDRLGVFLMEGKRKWKCFIPNFILGLDDKGKSPFCTSKPSLGFHDLDVTFDSEDVLSLQLPQKDCSDCFIYYELLNLVVDGEIQIDELAHIPSYNSSSTREQIRKIVENIHSIQ